MVQTQTDEWQEPIDLRPRYRLCRVAFFLGALSMGLYGLGSLLYVMGIMGQNRGIMRLLMSPLWDWLVGATVTFGSLVSSWLLIGRWPGSSWRTRTTLLALMNTVDLGYWVVEHAAALGLPFTPAARNVDGLGMVISRTMGLIELGLFASLAADVLAHLDWPDGEPIARVARAAAGIGMFLWMIVAFNQLDWLGGFPPRFLRMRLETFLLFLASNAARTVSAFFVTIVCSHACVQCSHVLEDLERQRKESDPFRSRSER